MSDVFEDETIPYDRDTVRSLIDEEGEDITALQDFVTSVRQFQRTKLKGMMERVSSKVNSRLIGAALFAIVGITSVGLWLRWRRKRRGGGGQLGQKRRAARTRQRIVAPRSTPGASRPETDGTRADATIAQPSVAPAASTPAPAHAAPSKPDVQPAPIVAQAGPAAPSATAQPAAAAAVAGTQTASAAVSTAVPGAATTAAPETTQQQKPADVPRGLQSTLPSRRKPKTVASPDIATSQPGVVQERKAPLADASNTASVQPATTTAAVPASASAASCAPPAAHVAAPAAAPAAAHDAPPAAASPAAHAAAPPAPSKIPTVAADASTVHTAADESAVVATVAAEPAVTESTPTGSAAATPAHKETHIPASSTVPAAVSPAAPVQTPAPKPAPAMGARSSSDPAKPRASESATHTDSSTAAGAAAVPAVPAVAKAGLDKGRHVASQAEPTAPVTSAPATPAVEAPSHRGVFVQFALEGMGSKQRVAVQLASDTPAAAPKTAQKVPPPASQDVAHGPVRVALSPATGAGTTPVAVRFAVEPVTLGLKGGAASALSARMQEPFPAETTGPACKGASGCAESARGAATVAVGPSDAPGKPKAAAAGPETSTPAVQSKAETSSGDKVARGAAPAGGLHSNGCAASSVTPAGLKDTEKAKPASKSEAGSSIPRTPQTPSAAPASQGRPGKPLESADTDAAAGCKKSDKAPVAAPVSKPAAIASTAPGAKLDTRAPSGSAPVSAQSSTPKATVKVHARVASAEKGRSQSADRGAARRRAPVDFKQYKLNADAPAFQPSSLVTSRSTSAVEPPTRAAEVPLRRAGGTEGGTGRQASTKGTDTQSGGARSGKRMAPVAVGTSEAGHAAGKENKGADGSAYPMPALVLAGAGIPDDAEQTPDEDAADERLVRVARQLQGLMEAGNHAEVRKLCVDELLAVLEFGSSHQCRPRKYAEHATTAADFFYQVGMPEQNEQVLVGAVQAARMCGDMAMATTLANNLGNVLRKLQKAEGAAALHTEHLQQLEAHGCWLAKCLQLARKNAVDALMEVQRESEARTILEHHVRSLQQEQQAAGVAAAAAAADDSTVPAGLALARAQLDFAKFCMQVQETESAVEQAQHALDNAGPIVGENSKELLPFLSYLGTALRAKERAPVEEHDGKAGKESTLKRAVQTFSRLAELLCRTASDTDRRLPPVLRTLADLNASLGQHKEALKYGHELRDALVENAGGKEVDGKLTDLWEYLAELYDMVGDKTGADKARAKVQLCVGEA